MGERRDVCGKREREEKGEKSGRDMGDRKEAWQEICEKGERLRRSDGKREGGMGEGWKNRETAWA